MLLLSCKLQQQLATHTFDSPKQENFNKVMKVTPSEDPDNVEISFL